MSSSTPKERFLLFHREIFINSQNQTIGSMFLRSPFMYVNWKQKGAFILNAYTHLESILLQPLGLVLCLSWRVKAWLVAHPPSTSISVEEKDLKWIYSTRGSKTMTVIIITELRRGWPSLGDTSGLFSDKDALFRFKTGMAWLCMQEVESLL